MRHETTKILVGSVPTRVELTASKEIWLRPAPDCESPLFIANRIGIEGFPIPPSGMRFDVQKEPHVTLYVSAATDFADQFLYIMVR